MKVGLLLVLLLLGSILISLYNLLQLQDLDRREDTYRLNESVQQASREKEHCGVFLVTALLHQDQEDNRMLSMGEQVICARGWRISSTYGPDLKSQGIELSPWSMPGEVRW